MKQSKSTNARGPVKRFLALSSVLADLVHSPGVRAFGVNLIANFVEFIRHPSNTMKTRVLATLGLFGVLALASAQSIPNPSLESNSFTNGPGTIAVNGPIVGWTTADANRARLNPASSSAFADNGATPDGANVAFIQGGPNSSLSTVISNLIVGKTYKVNFRADARAFGGPRRTSRSASTPLLLPVLSHWWSLRISLDIHSPLRRYP